VGVKDRAMDRERKEAVVLVSSRRRMVALAACAMVAGLVICPGPVQAATASPQANDMTGGVLGVSCASAVSCMAVGSFTVGNPGRPYVTGELYNGTSWKLIPMPEPKGAS
jgi:streptogramin lyase